MAPKETWAQSRDRLDGARGKKNPEMGNARATNANNTGEGIEGIQRDTREETNRNFLAVHEARIAKIEREGASLPMIIAIRSAIENDAALSESERRRLLARIPELIAANKTQADHSTAKREVFGSD